MRLMRNLHLLLAALRWPLQGVTYLEERAEAIGQMSYRRRASGRITVLPRFRWAGYITPFLKASPSLSLSSIHRIAAKRSYRKFISSWLHPYALEPGISAHPLPVGIVSNHNMLCISIFIQELPCTSEWSGLRCRVLHGLHGG
jgi:hypothetical protein